jgi:hypothetical protein
MARWPRWMGSNVPPKKATRILTMLVQELG